MEIGDFIRPLKEVPKKDAEQSSVIVILSPVEPSREQYENIRSFQDVYFVKATSLGGKDFIKAHMIDARAIVILANPLGHKFVHADEYMCDADAIRTLRYVAGVCRFVLDIYFWGVGGGGSSPLFFSLSFTFRISIMFEITHYASRANTIPDVREAKISPLLKVDIMRASNIKLIKNFVDEEDEREQSRQMKLFGAGHQEEEDVVEDEKDWVHDDAILNPNFASG